MQHLAAELGGERVGIEHALEDRPPRSVLQRPILPTLRRFATVVAAAEHDELRCDTTRLGEEARPLLLDEMAVEVAGEDALERAVRERQRERVTLHELSVRQSATGLREHARALVEP